MGLFLHAIMLGVVIIKNILLTRGCLLFIDAGYICITLGAEGNKQLIMNSEILESAMLWKCERTK